jgi:hypothetical protein
MALHVKCGSGPPVEAPTEIGQHYVDVTNKLTYESAGTSAVSDWNVTGGTGFSFDSFIKLLDTPSSYVGSANYSLRVNSAEDGVEFVSGFDLNSSTGFLKGGAITVNAGNPALIDVAQVDCIFADAFTDPMNPVVVEVSAGPFIGVALTNLLLADSTELLIDINGNLIQSSGVVISGATLRSLVSIGAAGHPSRVQVDFVIDTPTGIATSPGNTLTDLLLTIGPFNGKTAAGVPGNIFGPNGANLQIDKSEGKFFFPGANLKINRSDPNLPINPALTAASFIYTWQDGAGGWMSTFGNTSIDPTRYDDTTGGVGVPNGVVPNNNFTIQPIVISTQNDVLVYYGQTVYSTLAGAQAAIRTQVFLENPDFQGGLFRAWLILKKETVSLLNTANAEFVPARKFDSLD